MLQQGNFEGLFGRSAQRQQWRVEMLTPNESTPLREQAAMVRRQQLLISPHGAQNANFAFVQPCAAVLELLSPSRVAAR